MILTFLLKVFWQWKIICSLDMSHQMTNYLFFPLLHIAIGLSSWRDQLRISEGINSECSDQGAQKFIMLQTFSTMHINFKMIYHFEKSVTGVLCSLLASFSETTDSAPWHPSVKPTIAPAALHVPCAVDSLSCSRDTFFAETCSRRSGLARACSGP